MATKKTVITFTGVSISELRGRQSVRATFRLPKGTINAVSIVAAHLGIKQKSLFDHLISDLEEVSENCEPDVNGDATRRKKVQKTYVISRSSLDCLEQAAKVSNTSRDFLVEQLVEKLKPIIKQERQKHLKKKKALAELEECMLASQKMLLNTRQMLGNDDLVTEKIYSAVSAIENAHRQVLQLVERGDSIEQLKV